MGLNPDEGTYRLSAECPGVEINALRCTLGVRPMPFPAAGAVKGILHVTGPLEKPVFSGTVVAAPAPEAMAAAPQSYALDAMRAAGGDNWVDATPAAAAQAGTPQSWQSVLLPSYPSPVTATGPASQRLPPVAPSVAAYDKIPLSKGSLVFALDTATEVRKTQLASSFPCLFPACTVFMLRVA